MNKRRILLAAVALLTAGTASAWKVEGRITGVADKDSVTVTLFRYWGNTGRSIEKDTIRDGRFAFSGTFPSGELVMMSIDASNGRRVNRLWVTDATDLRISGPGDGDWTVASNEPEQAVQTELQAVDLSDLKALTESREGYYKYRDSVWRVSAERLWPVYVKHPNSRAMLCDLNFYIRVDAVPRERIQEVYDRLTPEVRATLEGEAIALALNPPHVPQVGEPFGDFPAADTSGIAHKLSDFAGRGKYVLLDFWSVGCGGCYAAFPEMKKIYEKYADRLEIIGVNLDGATDLWKGTVQWQQLPWIHLSDGKGNYGGAYVQYKVDVLPTYVLIDPQGTIVERWYPGQGDFQTRMIDPYLEKQ